MSKQKQKGTSFETACVRWLKERLGDERIHRAALTGAHDTGDIHGIFAHGARGIVECKNYKTYAPSLIATFKRQTLAEQANADADFSLLVLHANGTDGTGKRKSFGTNPVYVHVESLTRIHPTLKGKELGDFWFKTTLEDVAQMIEGRPWK